MEGCGKSFRALYQGFGSGFDAICGDSLNGQKIFCSENCKSKVCRESIPSNEQNSRGNISREFSRHGDHRFGKYVGGVFFESSESELRENGVEVREDRGGERIAGRYVGGVFFEIT